MVTNEEKRLAKMMLGVILGLAMNEGSWLANTSELYEYYDENDKAAGDVTGFTCANDIIRTLFLKDNPAIKRIRLRYIQDPAGIADTDMAAHQHKIAEAGESSTPPPPISLSTIWTERFTILAISLFDEDITKKHIYSAEPYARAETFLRVFPLEQRIALGRNIIRNSPHMLEDAGDWTALLVIILLPNAELREELERIGKISRAQTSASSDTMMSGGRNRPFRFDATGDDMSSTALNDDDDGEDVELQAAIKESLSGETQMQVDQKQARIFENYNRDLAKAEGGEATRESEEFDAMMDDDDEPEF
ncbi:hypothetical protein CC86DRAFT_408244 [Ophiobolus disseminans]|uniref:Uncharacterized protein n=1 Tax=Ophiobolus disseminans TaxID=1469910 RepID=A0A6A6ZTQ0_9PLEO|nr:hypothetical protein CC86DRAFT_408244 [Ophiobolus disseminans]